MREPAGRHRLGRVIRRCASLVAIVLTVSGCVAPDATGRVPTPTSSAPATATASLPGPTPAVTPTPTTVAPTPIALPSEAQLTAPSGSTVWALVGATRLFRSTDHGDTWQERPLPAPAGGREVTFVSDAAGWILHRGSPATQCQAQRVALSRTSDAGASWDDIGATGIADAGCKEAIVFTDMVHGYLDVYDPNGAPLIYRTTDGGRTWSASRPLADPPGFTTHIGGGSLVPGPVRSFGTTLLLDAAGSNNSTHYAYRSIDDGATWTYVNAAPAGPGPAIVFLTVSRWLQIAPAGGSRETVDGGASWHAFATDYGQAAPIVPVITFGDPMVGYATVRGAIQRTIDGGAHWTAIRTPGTF